MTSRFSLSVLSLLCLTQHVRSSPYYLAEDYSGSNFFNGFNYFTSPDPSGGWVTYVDQTTAVNNKYVVESSGVVYIGVDTGSVIPQSGPGRNAVRLVSDNSYNSGLFIADFEHMPGGICGVWPAFWMVGPNWPAGGEMDIVEGVNLNIQNVMTAHTAPGCNVNGAGMSAQLVRSNCNAGASSSDPSDGCSSTDDSTSSYGAPFNNAAGGVYAMQWTSHNISIYSWLRGQIPGNIASENPDPSTWGEPQMIILNSDCNIDQYFSNMQMVLDTDFCGGWIESQWQSSGCSAHASSCESYVANNPSAFDNAYWAVNYVRVFHPVNPADAAVKPKPTRTQTPLAQISAVGPIGMAMGATTTKTKTHAAKTTTTTF